MPPKHNNRLGKDYGPVPMPDNFTGSDEEFSMLRIIDGHEAPIDGMHGFVGAAGRNSHYPSSDDVTAAHPMGNPDDDEY